MNAVEIAELRLVNQRIAAAARPRLQEVVSWLGGMQAQDFAGALWSIGLRAGKATEAAVEREIAARTIIRTWPMRGTLHFAAAADVRWMLELLTPRLIAGSAHRRKALELDDAVFAKCEKLFVAALKGGRQGTREEMHAALEGAGISTASQRGYHILWRMAMDGVICFAERKGKEFAFALLEEWCPPAPPRTREEAVAELARRYFTSRGPATVQDFAWWSSLKASDARAGLEAAAPLLAKETFGGKTYWMPKETAPVSSVSPTAYLLPGFDEYLLGYQDRSVVLDPEHAPKIVPGNNGMFMPTIVIDGRVAGVWKRAVKRKAVEITLAPFTRLKRVERDAVAITAEGYGEYFGLPVKVVV